MSLKKQIAEILENNRDKYISGNTVAQQFNVTRAAVWKAVKSLSDDGYPIEAIPNKGYRLSSTCDILSAAGIKKYLSDNEFFNIEVNQCVSSTNTILKEKRHGGADEGYTVIAGSQTEGRGRLGRSFFSPSDTGIYISILLCPDIPPGDSVLMTTAAAVAVCKAIEELTDRPPCIKWVNDIYMDKKKVCGILTEASFSIENQKLDHLIVGVGINVYPPNSGFPDEIKESAGAVFTEKISDARNRLAAGFLNSFYNIYQSFENKPFIDEYKKRSFLIGKQVDVISSSSTTSAVVTGIDNNCRLLVQYGDGSCAALSSGEVRIKNFL